MLPMSFFSQLLRRLTVFRRVLLHAWMGVGGLVEGGIQTAQWQGTVAKLQIPN